jgi:DNA-3-methyladenine glycosylase
MRGARWRKLPRKFYLQPTLQVARRLPGKILVRRRGKRILAGRIVEVEAYLGGLDPASHAYRGMTRRNAVMFREGGRLYVYFTYGMHFCSNVVTQPAGIGQAVLLRAVEPLEGIPEMARNRGLQRRKRELVLDERTLLNLCSGPGKICQAFGLGRAENGADLCGKEVWIAEEKNPARSLAVRRSRRIGITTGRRHLWRFYVDGNRFVSRGKPVDP